MAEFKIYCINNTELDDFEALNRGFRSDVYVKTLDKVYHLNVYNIIRLSQDFELEFETHGFFGIEPNVIIVKEVDWLNIKDTVKNLVEQNFFDNLMPLNTEITNSLTLVE